MRRMLAGLGLGVGFSQAQRGRAGWWQGASLGLGLAVLDILVSFPLCHLSTSGCLHAFPSG